MKLKDLEAYRAVISTGSTLGAAQLLGISQSAISRRISQLEEDMDVRLFFREGSRLIPSRISEALESRIADVLERIHILNEATNDIRSGSFAHALLRIAVPPGISRRIMPRIIAEFLKLHPEIRFEVLHGTYDVIRRMLEEKQADLGFLRLPLTDPTLLNSKVIEARSVCVMATDHRLADKDVIYPTDLRNEPLVLLGWRRAPRHDLDLVFSSHGIRPIIRLEAHSVSSACGFSAEGIGISIVNSLLVQDCIGSDIVVRTFTPEVPHYFAFTYPEAPALPYLAKEFVEFATEVLLKISERAVQN